MSASRTRWLAAKAASRSDVARMVGLLAGALAARKELSMKSGTRRPCFAAGTVRPFVGHMPKQTVDVERNPRLRAVEPIAEGSRVNPVARLSPRSRR